MKDRTTWYECVHEMQTHPDVYGVTYSRNRPRRGRRIAVWIPY